MWKADLYKTFITNALQDIHSLIHSFNKYVLLPGAYNEELLQYMVRLTDSKWDEEKSKSQGVLVHHRRCPGKVSLRIEIWA